MFEVTVKNMMDRWKDEWVSVLGVDKKFVVFKYIDILLLKAAFI